MDWLVENSEAIASGGLILMTVMGVWVSLIDEITRRNFRYFLVVAFIGVALGTWYADVTAKRIFEEKITGGDNFFYFQVEPRQSDTELHTLLIINFRKKQLYDPFVEIFPLVNNEKQQRVAVVKDDVVRAAAIRIGPLLSAGSYKFEITARNGYWEQFLNFSQTENIMNQETKVIRNGKIIFSDRNRN